MTLPADPTAPQTHDLPRDRSRATPSNPPDGRPSTEPPPSSYEELDGGTGREIYFRPHRYRFADLGPVRASVTIMMSGVERVCELRDVSQSGVAFEWDDTLRLQVGDVVPRAVVSFDQQDAYRGAARISSVRSADAASVVGMSFLDGLMNIDDVLQLRDVRTWTGSGQGLDLDNRPWKVSGFDSFKALVAELRLFLLDAQRQMDALEESLPWHVTHGNHRSLARTALIDRLQAEVVRPVVSLASSIDAALRGASDTERQGLKDFSVMHLQDLLNLSPWAARSRNKPLGYPGDYEIMNGIYGDHFAGSTLFAKALNMAVVSMPAAAAVRERKNLMKHQLAKRLDEHAAAGCKLRVLSIAAGPAQEIYELLAEASEIPVPVEIVLFDQDKRALGFAHDRLKRLVSTRWGERVKLMYLHDSIKRLLTDDAIFADFGTFDVVFSCGLFDYLQLRTASSLVRSFYATLARGGTVYIGNMTPDNPSRWIMEHHLDWWLTYRERSDLVGIARVGAPTASISVLEEATGINPFVALTKD